MTSLISAKNVSKSFGKFRAVDDVSFEIEKGRIAGLIGPNGAGKTTLLKAILGLTDCQGQLSVLGLDPFRQRKELMQNICFIADVAVLPRWIRVSQLIDFIESIHPRFSRTKAQELIAKTKIPAEAKVRELSKGMVAQLHLSIIMAVDAKLLVLDEPTLGLDIIFRKEFYSNILNDYFDQERTILITTHQVEEIENLLTDVMFINNGRLILNTDMDTLPGQFAELLAKKEFVDDARQMKPIHEREMFGKRIMTFAGADRDKLNRLGEVRTPAIADLFVAMMKGAAS
jgi:ABC-2 type transport system ATP-binding protein